jgi:hypothetical protein
MDASKFDDLTISLGSHRRSLLRALLAGAITALLGRGDPAVAGPPACTADGQRCRRSNECCSGNCKKKKGKKRGTCKPCPAGQFQCDGGCHECCANPDCPQGQTCCLNEHRCRDVRNDAAHCGQCANGQCPGGAICANGDCGLTCTEIGQECFPGCECARRVDAAHLNQKVCAGLGVFDCDSATTCDDSDADCAPATAGFRQVCVSDLCPGKNVCADPCA